MSYTVKITSVKPANVEWFSDANPMAIETYKAWAVTLPGIVSLSKNQPDANTIIRTYVFESEAAYSNFVAAHYANTEHLQRIDYNNANGITFVSQVIGD